MPRVLDFLRMSQISVVGSASCTSVPECQLSSILIKYFIYLFYCDNLTVTNLIEDGRDAWITGKAGTWRLEIAVLISAYR